MNAADIQPAKLTPAAADRICLSCHLNQPTHAGRINSSHAKNQVSCVSCHAIHKNGPDGLVARKPADINRHAPPAKRRVGQLPAPLSASAAGRRHVVRGLPQSPRQRRFRTPCRCVDANEPGCFKCHGDKRGPFTYEHAPVRMEGCTACHQPHGSANPRMLTRAQVGFVCLECHANLPTPTPPANGTLGTFRRRSMICAIRASRTAPSATRRCMVLM